MATQMLYHASLVGHIIGLTMMAGTTAVDYFISVQFWKQYRGDRSGAIAIQAVTSKTSILTFLGMLLLIISGVSMMVITKGAWGEQTWFRIKFGLLLLLIVNAIVIGRRLRTRLMKILREEAGKDQEAALARIRKYSGLFHLSQLALFAVVFTLSVFKFN